MLRSPVLLFVLSCCLWCVACGQSDPPAPSSSCKPPRRLPASLMVREVRAGSPAEIAGVLETDYLAEFCGVEVRDVPHLADLQHEHRADSEVTWIFHSSNGALVATGAGIKTVKAPPGPIGVTFK